MNVQIYADGKPVYDSRIPVPTKQIPLRAQIKESLNKGGTATLILPPGHPSYDAFSPLKTEITIWKNGHLRWRGRALVPDDDLYCRRTIICEGELCFFNDAIQRPYTFSGPAHSVFARIITGYNAAVEPWKRFAVGTVTMDVSVDLDSDKAEKAYETLRKLVSQYGGYILFDTAPDGSRRINWYKVLPYSCNQKIRFGKNLLDYSTQSGVTGFVTRIIPYGAEDEEGNRLTLNSLGRDYVENEEARALCGIVEDVRYYDDVTDVLTLKLRAEADLLTAATLPRLIQMSAVDLSHQDMTLDSFRMGQRIEGESAAHKMAGLYDLVSLEEDLMDPGSGDVTLTRSADYLDGAGSLIGSVSQAQKDEAERTRQKLLAQVQEYREKIKQALEKAKEMAEEAQKAAEEYADDAAEAAGDAAVEESKEYTDVELKETSTAIIARVEKTDGDVAELKVTASRISSRVDDAEGNISSLQQTSTALSSRISDAEGNLSAVTQKVNSLTIKVTNEKSKSTITISANGVEIASQDITFDGLVTFDALKGSGTTEINGSNIVTGIIEALKVALRGEFQIYSGDTLAGSLGYIEGTTGAEITSGVGLAGTNKRIYIAVTNKGFIGRAGNHMIYATEDVPVTVVGDLRVTGAVSQNVS